MAIDYGFVLGLTKMGVGYWALGSRFGKLKISQRRRDAK